MATLRIAAIEGATTVFLTSLGGTTGTPNGAGYALTQIVGLIHDATVTGLTGPFYAVAKDDDDVELGYVTRVTMVDDSSVIDTTYGVPSELIDQITTAISSGAVRLISPYDPLTQNLTLVQNADYKTGSLYGPLSFLITRDDISEDDAIRFAASLPGSREIRISATGTVVDVSGDLYAQVSLTKETETNRTPSECWRWELEHIDGSGNVTPLIVDQEMILKPSHSG